MNDELMERAMALFQAAKVAEMVYSDLVYAAEQVLKTGINDFDIAETYADARRAENKVYMAVERFNYIANKEY